MADLFEANAIRFFVLKLSLMSKTVLEDPTFQKNECNSYLTPGGGSR